jgi:hypothetical protein
MLIDDEGEIASLNVTRMFVVRLTPVWPEYGERDVMVGATESAVVNDHTELPDIWFPARSRAPVSVAVYVASDDRALFGLSVTVRVAASYVTTDETTLFEEFRRTNEIVAGCTASLNVAVTFAVPLTPVAPEAGTRAVTVGAVVSAIVNDHAELVIWLPARSRAPDSVAVYAAPEASVLLGLSVTVRVAALYVTTDVTTLFDALRRTNEIVAGWTSSLKVAVTLAVPLTPVAPDAGTRAVMVGAMESPTVNDHAAGAAMALPARSWAVIVAVYVAPDARDALGFNVAVCVPAL